MSEARALPTEDERNAIREGVRAVVTKFGDDYWLARDDDGEFPREFHRAAFNPLMIEDRKDHRPVLQRRCGQPRGCRAASHRWDPFVSLLSTSRRPSFDVKM